MMKCETKQGKEMFGYYFRVCKQIIKNEIDVCVDREIMMSKRGSGKLDDAMYNKKEKCVLHQCRTVVDYNPAAQVANEGIHATEWPVKVDVMFSLKCE